MKVQLINVAEYEIKDGKTNDIPFNTFVNLCGGVGTGKTDILPKVRLFKTMGEFSEELYQEIELVKDPDHDNSVVEDAYLEAFMEIWE